MTVSGVYCEISSINETCASEYDEKSVYRKSSVRGCVTSFEQNSPYLLHFTVFITELASLMFVLFLPLFTYWRYGTRKRKASDDEHKKIILSAFTYAALLHLTLFLSKAHKHRGFDRYNRCSMENSLPVFDMQRSIESVLRFKFAITNILYLGACREMRIATLCSRRDPGALLRL